MAMNPPSMQTERDDEAEDDRHECASRVGFVNTLLTARSLREPDQSAAIGRSEAGAHKSA